MQWSGTMSVEAFDTNKYYEAQMSVFLDRLERGDDKVVEFGGKPFGDQHAARVLPGYDSDIKAYILRDLAYELGDTTIAMSLHAQDILAQPDGRRVARRIRGDSGLHYDEEVLRLIDQAATDFGLPINTVVLTALPSQLSPENKEYINAYIGRLKQACLNVKTIGLIDSYPLVDVNKIANTLTADEPIANTDNLIVISPGGGSGKFCVAISEIAHKLKCGKNPNFVKFETFPVFTLPIDHPLNVAFLAAIQRIRQRCCLLNGTASFRRNDYERKGLRRWHT
jgi:uncharacterized protein (UPF0371 family)